MRDQAWEDLPVPVFPHETKRDFRLKFTMRDPAAPGDTGSSAVVSGGGF